MILFFIDNWICCSFLLKVGKYEQLSYWCHADFILQEKMRNNKFLTLNKILIHMQIHMTITLKFREFWQCWFFLQLWWCFCFYVLVLSLHLLYVLYALASTSSCMLSLILWCQLLHSCWSLSLLYYLGGTLFCCCLCGALLSFVLSGWQSTQMLYFSRFSDWK